MIAVQVERGQEPPKWFDEEPSLAPGEDFYLRAFWDLDSERQVGMSLGRIPRSKAEDYAGGKGLDSAMMDVFWVVIQRMDAEYLEWVQKEQDKKSKSSSKGKGVGNRRIER